MGRLPPSHAGVKLQVVFDPMLLVVKDFFAIVGALAH